MIFSCAIYSKSGKLRKRITAKTLQKRHWQNFEDNERKRRRFTNGSKSMPHPSLKEFRYINAVCDELHMN